MRIAVMLRGISEKQGTGVYTIKLMRHLLRVDKKNEYYLFFKGRKENRMFSEFENVKEEKWIRSPSKFLWDQFFIPILLKKYRIDLVFNPKFTLPLLSKVKGVFTLHGSEWYIHPDFYKWWDVLYIRIFLPLYIKKAFKVISVCHKAKDDIITLLNVDERKIEVVPLAVGEEFGVIEDRDFLGRIREKYKLPRKFFLNPSMIYPGKNMVNTLVAFAKFRKHFPLYSFVHVGGYKWKYKEVMKVIKEYDLSSSFIDLGWVEHTELPAFYNLADALIFPSFYECFPSPPLEAMACGCPVVVGGTGGTPEVVGDAAILVNPDNIDEIYGAMIRIVSDPKLRKELINKGFERCKLFSWDKVAINTLEVFKHFEKTVTNSIIL